MILPAVWVACAIAGILYAHQQNIPQAIVFAVLPAILLEVGFYYALAHDRIRGRIEKWIAQSTDRERDGKARARGPGGSLGAGKSRRADGRTGRA